ncbi:hypothetical protein GCM10023214_65220 [Amycolatopsis dongchuanensis]|uniref:Uncharacterized protein n=1 Tax=Amycolatopsis dongchuanensis TaxID=1070866 RepID=A0ABP8VH13_9PSEU
MVEQSTSVTLPYSHSFTCSGNVLAWETGGDDINARHLAPVDGSDVPQIWSGNSSSEQICNVGFVFRNPYDFPCVQCGEDGEVEAAITSAE